jgi:hypothetical protein
MAFRIPFLVVLLMHEPSESKEKFHLFFPLSLSYVYTIPSFIYCFAFPCIYSSYRQVFIFLLWKNFSQSILVFIFPFSLYFLLLSLILLCHPFHLYVYCHSSLYGVAMLSPTLAMTEDSSPFPCILTITHCGFPERAWNYYLHVHILILLLLIKICRFSTLFILSFIPALNF